MGAKGFILTLLLFAVVGAGAGYGAAQLVPMEEEEAPPETADLVAPGAGGGDAGAGAGAGTAGTGRARPTGGQPSVDDIMATMPEEMRRELANNPEAAAMARAQIQMAIDSGMIPPEALQELAGGGAAGAVPGETEAAGARNAEPLTGTVVSFEGGTLRLETPDGEASIALPDDAPVNLTKTVADSDAYLADGAEVSVIARPDDSGGLAAAAVIVGAGAQGAGAGRGLGGFAPVLMGTITSLSDGVLTLESANGPAEFAVPDETPVRITATAAEAAGELTAGVSLTAFVQREADGSLSAASVNVGGAGGGFGPGLFGGGRQRGSGQGGDGGESGG